MKTIRLLFCICTVLLLVACGSEAPDEIDISGYADETLTLFGLADNPVEVTIADLAAMECVAVETESTSDKIGKVRATGVWLDTLLAPYGLKQKDFSKIVITGADEYDTKLYQKYLKKHDILLAFGINGKPLEADAVPCRIIIKKSDSAYWVRQVRTIEFYRSE